MAQSMILLLYRTWKNKTVGLACPMHFAYTLYVQLQFSFFYV